MSDYPARKVKALTVRSYFLSYICQEAKIEIKIYQSMMSCDSVLVKRFPEFCIKFYSFAQELLYFYILLISLFQQLHSAEKDWMSAMNVMGRGAEYALSVRSEYTRLLFMLSRGMVRNFFRLVRQIFAVDLIQSQSKI